MHPELRRALARQRQTEFLAERGPVGAPAWLGRRRNRSKPGMVVHIRRVLGSALLGLGSRVMPSGPPAVRLFDGPTGRGPDRPVCRW